MSESPKPAQRSARVGAPMVALVFVVALVLWGGYSQHWSWTGINGQTATLWDWLHLLLLPLAVAFLPIWMSRRTRVGRRQKMAAITALAVFAVVVLAGYLVPWAWTGFSGNNVWDWLELLALPLAVALIPVFGELREKWTRRYTIISGITLAVFATLVLGAYVGDWTWTGFRGNTLWNWLQLLLVPLLIPTVIVPALAPMAVGGVTRLDDDEQPV